MRSGRNVEYRSGELRSRTVSIVEGSQVTATRFAELVLPEIDVLGRVALAITGNRADAEDLVQETLISAFRSIERFDGRFPRAWLLTILRNCERSRHRRRRPGLLRDPEILDNGCVFGQITEEGPESKAISEEFRRGVGDALSCLASHLRETVEAVDVTGLSYAEAAALLDVPVGTIMSRLHRGRRVIRKDLTSKGLAPGRGSS